MVGIISILKQFGERKPVAEVPHQVEGLPRSIQLGKIIEVPYLDIELAKHDKSRIGVFDYEQAISTIGLVESNLALIRIIYLADGKTFIRLVKVNDDFEATIFHLHEEIFPQNEEEWKFWIDPKEGLIGWPQFQLNSDVYDLIWGNTKEYQEVMVPLYGKIIPIIHQGAEYTRKVKDTVEHLLVQTCIFDDDCSINIYIGVKIELNDIETI